MDLNNLKTKNQPPSPECEVDNTKNLNISPTAKMPNHYY